MSEGDSRFFRLGASVGALAIAGCYSSAAFAQQPGIDAPAIEEIIVTAQKREQRLQDVPIAVTAISQEAIQANRVISIMDLTALAPGLLARTNAGSLGSPSFSMRGVFASASQPSSDRQISTYIDGVYIGSSRGSVFDLPDIQRIEVLRGPQGTLFGRNATAGAVSVTTRDPKGRLSFRQEVTLGNYNQFRTRTTIDTPQFGPFSAYVTYVHDERRGDVRNLGAGTTFDRTSPFTPIGQTRSPQYLGDRNFENVFVALKFEPSDRFSATYKFDYSDGDNTPEARVPLALNSADFTGGTLAAILAAQPAGGGAYGPVSLYPDAKRPNSVNNAWSMEGFQKVLGHNLTMNLGVTDSLSFKNITAYRESEVYGPSTIMGLSGLQFTAGSILPYAQFAVISQLGAGFFALTPAQQGAAIGGAAAALAPAVGSYFAGYEGNSYGRAWQVSDEFQANYVSKNVQITVGALYYHSFEVSSGLPGMAANFAFQPLGQQLPLGNISDSVSRTTSYALYTQGEFTILPKLDVVLGARLTRDEKEGSLTVGGIYTGSRTSGSISGTTYIPWTFAKTKPSFSAGLNYAATDDLMIYGKYSTAFMSGGAVGSLSFEPETVKSWEGGIKSEWFDHRLRANLAVYTATYDHSQSSQSGFNVGQPLLGVVVIDNGTLQAKGFELELTAAPTRGVTMGGSLGYTDAKLKNPNPIVTGGRPFELTAIPEWIGNVYGQYDTGPIAGDAEMTFRLDANYQGKYRAIPYTDVAKVTPVFAPYEFTKARWIVNGRVTLKNIDIEGAKGEFALWGRNLFNNRDISYALLFGSIEMNASYQPARTFGADFIISY